MPSLQIRDLPDDLYQALSFRARQQHRSLAQQAVVELRRIPSKICSTPFPPDAKGVPC
jgi:plasmid stability protein